MTLLAVVILLFVALAAAAICMLFVPRQKRALPFEVVMWLAAWLVAALCAWLMWGAVQSFAPLHALSLVHVAGIAIVPLLLGAFGGALVLTVPLGFLDRMSAGEDAEA